MRQILTQVCGGFKLPTSAHKNLPWSILITTMANRPITYTLLERKAGFGKDTKKIVYQAYPSGRKRVDHRTFCEEVGRATTFTGAEIEAVLRLAAEIAKHHVENGDIVDFGDIGSLRPSFQSKTVEKAEDFNANVHITKPVVKLIPSTQYFTLSGVSYERVEAKPKKEKKPAGTTTTTTTGSDPEAQP